MNPRIHSLLEEIYGRDSGSAAAGRLNEAMLDHASRISKPSHAPETEPGNLPVSEGDSVMITYGDQFRGSEAMPLQYLRRFMEDHLEEVIRGVHILPFSPYSSDDGFSVIDYRQVNPDLGTWKDVEAIGSEYRLMVDLVLNHCSAHSQWFLKFKEDEEPYTRYFMTASPEDDLSQVVRPRAHPLLTPVETASGTRHVWTTFSADQVDLNFADPIVLLEMVDILLEYVERGMQIVRLDAIAYLWKEIGHPSIHHPKTHLVVQLFRAVLEELAPWVVIITETNVPHQENLSYFGDGNNEAHMVYNFSLPPLTLDAMLREDTRHLQRWATSLPEASTSTTFFNFLASHDGIGLLPATGILSQDEIDGMIKAVKERGGRISYKATPEGEIPYEMNVNYLSAVTDPALPEEQRARVFLASQAIMLSLAGVPGIYVHSLIGSENWSEGVEETGHNRAINREKLDFDEAVHDLLEEGTLRRHVFEGYKQLLEARIREPAFHPAATQQIVEMPHQVFCVIRGGAAAAGTGSPAAPSVVPVICLINVSADDVVCHVDLGYACVGETKSFSDIITSDTFFPHWDGPTRISLELRPYEVMWLKPI
jgi:sucrose phosphorylase